MIGKMTGLMRKNLVAGILVLIPLVVIAWIGNGLMGLVSELLRLMPEPIRPRPEFSPLINTLISIGIFAILLFAISGLGWLSKLYLGRKILELLRILIQRIPIFGTIYNSIDQLLNAFSIGGDQFSRVVFLEYPRKESWTVGFVTGEAPFPSENGRQLSIFVPTVPNPTSGFYMMIPEKDVRDANMSVEEAFRLILSLGVSKPQVRAP